MLGIVGEKIGMTQVYGEQGGFVPVTVIRVEPNVVTDIRRADKHGYESVQLASGKSKEHRVRKPQRLNFKKLGVDCFGTVKEFRTDKASQFKIGAQIRVDVLKAGEAIDVQGVSKGRGFQGVIKRWHFAGGADSHGCSVSHRVPGSIGERAYPGRVFPGKKLPGQMGNARVTVQNLKVVAVEAEQNLLLVQGGVPGGQNAKVVIYPHAVDFADRVLKSIPKTDAGKTETQDASAE